MKFFSDANTEKVNGKEEKNTDLKKEKTDIPSSNDAQDNLGEQQEINETNAEDARDTSLKSGLGKIADADGKLKADTTFVLNGIKYTTDKKGKIEKIDGVFVGDDNGKQYRDELGNPLSNCTYTLDGVRYDTDDGGNVYMIDGKLKPNVEYVLNGNIYTTDEKGRIIRCKAFPKRTPENPRDNEAQRRAGLNDRLDNDQGGHIVSRDLGGDSGTGNLVAMDARINGSDYKRMENSVKEALDDNKCVSVDTNITYEADSDRPQLIKSIVTIDDTKTVFVFDNDLENTLFDEIPLNGKDLVNFMLDDVGGCISSITQKYDSKGELQQVIVWITYSDNGKNRRMPVVIDNAKGVADK